MKLQPSLATLTEVEQSPHLAPPVWASHSLWHAESPPLVAGTLVLLGVFVNGGRQVTWPWCRVRACIGGRVRVEVEDEMPDRARGFITRGDVFDIDPAVHVHLALFDAAAGWRQEREQLAAAAAASEETKQ